MSGLASPKYRRQKKESGDLAFVELNLDQSDDAGS